MSSNSVWMTTRDWMRLGLLLLGIPQAGIGLWAIADPTAWFDTFPGGGHNWLPEFGPFNEHLAVDAGAGLFAAGVVAIAAAVMLERRVVQIAMVAFLAWSIPHALWHLTALDEALAAATTSPTWPRWRSRSCFRSCCWRRGRLDETP